MGLEGDDSGGAGGWKGEGWGEEQAGRKPGQLFPSDGEQSSLLASRALSLLIPPPSWPPC